MGTDVQELQDPCGIILRIFLHAPVHWVLTLFQTRIPQSPSSIYEQLFALLRDSSDLDIYKDLYGKNN